MSTSLVPSVVTHTVVDARASSLVVLRYSNTARDSQVESTQLNKHHNISHLFLKENDTIHWESVNGKGVLNYVGFIYGLALL